MNDIVADIFRSRSELIDRFLSDVTRVCKFSSSPRLRSGKMIRNPYSRVYRLEFEVGTRTRVVYVKQRQARPGNEEAVRNRMEQEFQMMQKLALDPTCGYGVVRPVGVYPDVMALATMGVGGRDLSWVVRRGSRRPALRQRSALHHVAESGRWLRRFHQVTFDQHREFDVEELVHYNAPRLEKLRQYRLPLPLDFPKRVEEILIARSNRIPRAENPVAGRHNDFAGHNIICDGEAIRVLDFEMYDLGSTRYDVVRLWLQLELLKSDPLRSRRALDALQTAFLNAYGIGATVDDPLFELVQTRYRLNALLNALDSPARRGMQARYMRRVASSCIAWLQQFCNGRG